MPEKNYSAELLRRADEVAVGVGEMLVGNGEAFRSIINVEINKSERRFSPVPIPKIIDDIPTLVCSEAGYEVWLKSFGGTTILDDENVMDLYLATGFSWLELSMLGKSAKIERQFIDEEDPRAQAMARSSMIINELIDRRKLDIQAKKLGDIGLSGVVESVSQLSEEEVLSINRYRYGLGVGLQYLQLTIAEREELEVDLYKMLEVSIKNFRSGLIDILIKFADFELANLVTDEAFEKGFPSLIFAAAMPMNVSFINERK